MKYYLIIDNSVQWFTKIVSQENDKIWESIDVPIHISGTFINSIFERELHFTNRTFKNETYGGWTISKAEFERIKKLTELYPKYLEYIKLA